MGHGDYDRTIVGLSSYDDVWKHMKYNNLIDLVHK